MNRWWQGSLLIAALLLYGCGGETTLDNNNDTKTPLPDPLAACTDPDTCCSAEEMVCEGNVDDQLICGCSKLWDCSKDPKKCEQVYPETPDGPTGGGDWNCTWSEFKYTCTKESPEGPGDTPPGGGDWNCVWRDKEFTWECTIDSPNPSNTPEGAGNWSCEVMEDNRLVCERTTTDGPPPGGDGEWNCYTTEDGRYICERTDSPGLPDGSGDWKCSKTTVNGVPTWVCYGTTETPPGGGGWNCVEVEGEFNTYKCEKAEGTDDIPPGGGWWACVKGSEFEGTVCEQVTKEPTPPTPEPKEGDTCRIGEKMWCDGLQYCGWGQVDCDPATNTWRTKEDSEGNLVLDCQELSNGARPNTVCACYHFYYNPACCERADCLVPEGSEGQICPDSGGQLCDYCNPQDPECVEAGARCVVTNSHETFCGRECSDSKPCPAGYDCKTYNLQNGVAHQCIPIDFSCYY